MSVKWMLSCLCLCLAGCAGSAWAGNPEDWLNSTCFNFTSANSGAVVDAPYAAALLRDRGVMIVGQGQSSPSSQTAFGMLQLDWHVSLNRDFAASTGKRLYPFAGTTGNSIPFAVARQPDGKFLARGYSLYSTGEFMTGMPVVFNPRSRELIVPGSNETISTGATAVMVSRFEADDTELIFSDRFE